MRKLLALVFSAALLAISIVALLSVTRFTTTPANAAPNPIDIISISELSSTSVEILFNSTVPKKSLSYYVINVAADLPAMEQQNSKTQNVASIAPKNFKKVIKIKATGLITAEIKNLNPGTAYKFSVSAKTNKAKMISSEVVEYSSLSNLMDALSNLPADWGNPKPIQIPVAAPAPAPVILSAPAFTLTSSTESRTVNTTATGFTISSTGGAIASFAINATPPGMSFNTTTGALTGTPNTVAAATTYTITATNTSASATQTFTLTVTAVYTVGQRGPGGGIVYYVSDNYFTSTGSTCNTECKYLEVAPSTWQSGGISVADDSGYVWSNNGTATTGQDIVTASTEGVPAQSANEKFNWKIGQGFYNTSVMKVSGAISAAQAAVLAYAGGSTAGQWFIPSINELNELCKYARGQTTGDLKVACTSSGTLKTTAIAGTDLGGFVEYYWSSSEREAFSAWFQRFNGGTPGPTSKGNPYWVRPVRAF